MGGVSINSLCQQDGLFALSVNRHSALFLECLFTLSANSPPCWQKLFTPTPPTKCDLAGQYYKGQLPVVSPSGTCGKMSVGLILTRSTRVRIHLLANFFFLSLFKFQITSEKHLFSINIKEITKKLEIKYRVGYPFPLLLLFHNNGILT